MEVSGVVENGIKTLQAELLAAIKHHQALNKESMKDPNNMELKEKLFAVQKRIIQIGAEQKHLLRELRQRMNASPMTLGLNNNVSIKNKRKCMPARPRSVSSTSSPSTSEDSQDSQQEEVVATCRTDPDREAKIKFMSALGLVTREALAELQKKRVERKRRSTANHTQFVYGSSWDVSKRKKNSYLTSGTPTPPRRSLRIEAPTVAPTENTETLRIPGLPASLTIERIKTQVCLVCRKPGGLGVCNSCTAEYHTACAAQCPQCSLKTEPEQLKAKEGERDKLLSRNVQLNRDKEDLQKKSSELSTAIAAQEEKRKNLLASEEATRKKIQAIQDFVSIIKTSPHAPS